MLSVSAVVGRRIADAGIGGGDRFSGDYGAGAKWRFLGSLQHRRSLLAGHGQRRSGHRVPQARHRLFNFGIWYDEISIV